MKMFFILFPAFSLKKLLFLFHLFMYSTIVNNNMLLIYIDNLQHRYLKMVLVSFVLILVCLWCMNDSCMSGHNNQIINRLLARNCQNEDIEIIYSPM